MRRISAALAVTCLSVAGCGDAPGSHGRPGPKQAVATARSYIDAFNRRDGKAICALWSDDVRSNFQASFAAFLPGNDCPRFERLIGYQEDNGSGAWTEARVLRVGPARLIGNRAEVPIVERHLHAQGGGTDNTISDVIHLVASSGRWRVAKFGGIFYSAIGNHNLPEGALDPPGDPALVGKPSRLPAPNFTCEPTTTTRDDTGDVTYREGFDDSFKSSDAPWLDIKAASAGQGKAGTCFTIELAAPPRPDTSFMIATEQSTGRPDGSFTQGSPAFRIDGLDHPHMADGVRRFGVRGTRVYVLVPPAVLRAGAFRWGLRVLSLQDGDPALHDPAKGSDSVSDGVAGERRLSFP